MYPLRVMMYPKVMWGNRCTQWIASKRFISLIRPADTTYIPTQAELNTATNTSSEPLFSEKDDEILTNSRFQVLGQPATMASIVIPPSIDLYVRRGCIVSLHGSPNIALSHGWRNVWFNLSRYLSLNPSLYHKLISTTRFDALIAPNIPSNILEHLLGRTSSPFRTLCLLNLDGTRDWNVWGKDSVIAFEGNTSLNMTPARFKLFKKQRTAFSSKFQIIQGRGNVLLSGSGSVYTIELKNSNDEIIIKSEHLLGLSGTSQLDMKQAVSVQNLAPLKTRIKNVSKNEVPNSEIRDFDVKMFFQITVDILKSTWNWLKSAYLIFVNTPTKFLRIKGPRTLLVQSSYNTYFPSAPKNSGFFKVPANRKLSSSSSQNNEHSKNYLNYVSVSKNGKMDFRSTDDFSESIKGP